ncbi:DNA-directed RNA polymerase subunit L [Candidatus Micrarchaeota archaeon]|nr:DNA-directed RNA polymerase subunit L [Candidatus Micrarchaeota archaeon]
MKVNFLVDEDKHVEVLLEGEEHSLPNVLKDILLESDDVEFAAYVIDHPLVGSPKLIIKTKRKKARETLKNALATLQERLKEFETALKKEKKK